MSSFVKFWALKELKTKMSKLLEMRQNALKVAEMQNELSRLRMLRGILVEVQQKYSSKEKDADLMMSQVCSSNGLDYEELKDQFPNENEKKGLEASCDKETTEWNVEDDLSIVNFMDFKNVLDETNKPEVCQIESIIDNKETKMDGVPNETAVEDKCNDASATSENLHKENSDPSQQTKKEELATIYMRAQTPKKIYEVHGRLVSSNCNLANNDNCNQEGDDKKEVRQETKVNKTQSLPEVILPNKQNKILNCSKTTNLNLISSLREQPEIVHKAESLDNAFGHYLQVGYDYETKERDKKPPEEFNNFEYDIDDFLNGEPKEESNVNFSEGSNHTFSEMSQGIEDINRMSNDRLEKLQQFEEQLGKFSRDKRKEEFDTEPVLDDEYSVLGLDGAWKEEYYPQKAKFQSNYADDVENFLRTKCVKLQEIAAKLEALQNNDFNIFKRNSHMANFETRSESTKAGNEHNNDKKGEHIFGGSLSNKISDLSPFEPIKKLEAPKSTHTQEQLKDMLANATDYICELIDKIAKGQNVEKVEEMEAQTNSLPNSETQAKPHFSGQNEIQTQPELQIQPNKVQSIEPKINTEFRSPKIVETPSKLEAQPQPEFKSQSSTFDVQQRSEIHSKPKTETKQESSTQFQSSTIFAPPFGLPENEVKLKSDKQLQQLPVAKLQSEVHNQPTMEFQPEMKLQLPPHVLQQPETQTPPKFEEREFLTREVSLPCIKSQQNTAQQTSNVKATYPQAEPMQFPLRKSEDEKFAKFGVHTKQNTEKTPKTVYIIIQIQK